MSYQKLKEKVRAKYSKLRERLSPAPSQRPSRQSSPLPLPDPSRLATNEPTTSIPPAPNLGERNIETSSISQLRVWDAGSDGRPSPGPSEQASGQSSSLPLSDPSRSATNEPTTVILPAPNLMEWDIDASAISQLRAWGAAREGSKWIQLLEKIDGALKSKTLEVLVAFVPDSPFPAKTLVGALLNLVQLGINIPMIQKKVYDFAQEAIDYIREIVAVVGEEDSLKDGLKNIFEAVNNVCQWASKQLSKKSLSEEELGEWKERIVRAKEIFVATSLIRIQAAKAASDRQSFIKEKLATHIASYYEHTDQHKNTCAPGTRIDVLANIMRWLSQSSGNEHIYWVTGLPGSGKSTIAATVVETLRELGTPIAAQYFISRNFVDTTDPDRLFPTIAKQLAERFPAAARVVHDVLKNGFPSGRNEPAGSLFLRPIHEISKSGDVVVVIDALDELRSDADTMVSLLAKIGSELPGNVKFFITSRPESWSDLVDLNHAVFRQRHLNTEDSEDEVGKFIRTSIAEITPKKPEWKDWPSDRQLDGLVDNASGLFHYAVTAIAWIKAQINIYGAARRETILEKVSSSGVGGLDQLYNIILTRWKDMETDPEEQLARLKCFRHIVGCIIVMLGMPLSVGDFIALLANSLPVEFDVENFLQQMRSILVPGTASPFTDAIPQMHKSFYDFITSNRSSTDFRVVAGDAHLAAAKSCLKVIIMTGNQPDTSSRYAIGNWYKHLKQAMEGDAYYDEEMWRLLDQMGTKVSLRVWSSEGYEYFEFVMMAYLGWGMLKRNIPGGKLGPIINILARIKEGMRTERYYMEGYANYLMMKEEEEERNDGVPYCNIYDNGILEEWRKLHPEPNIHATTFRTNSPGPLHLQSAE